MGNDVPYWIETSAGRLLELPVHWRHEDWPLFGFVPSPRAATNSLAIPSTAFEIFAEEFEGLYQRGGLFTLTLHPSVIGRFPTSVVGDPGRDHRTLFESTHRANASS